jgi:hypothetical protein
VDGHPVAYEAILRGNQTFEKQRVFLKEDSEQIVNHPELSEKVPEWMVISKQVATGNRRRVLENGIDKMNSDDQDDPDMKPDEESGMYTSEMDPLKGPVVLTQSQIAAQKAPAQALKTSKSPPRSQSPMPTGSSDDDEPESPQYIWSTSRGIFRKNKRWVGPNAGSESRKDDKPATRSRAVADSPSPAPARQPTRVTSDTEDHEEMTKDQKRLARLGKKKAAASQRAPAGSPTKEPKASHPMATRTQEANRAGGLRGVVGSGSNGDTCVAQGNPSSKPGS